MRWPQGWNSCGRLMPWPIRNCRRNGSGCSNSAICKAEPCATRSAPIPCWRGRFALSRMKRFDHITRRAAEIGQALQEKTGCQISVRFSEGYPPVYNDPALYDQVVRLMDPDGFVPLQKPALIAEDFSFYQQVLPGLFFFLGVGGDYPLHSARFQFDETVLERGVALYQALLQL